MRYIILILFSSFIFQYVHSCGGVVHNEIGKRSLEFYKNNDFASYALKYPECFQSATIFPDWGYNSKSTDEASEFAHWTTFSKAFASYISKNYERPFNEKAQKLIAFYLGIVLHSVTDVLWHDLSNIKEYIGQGFIESQAKHIFDDDYSLSHTVADVGGEFVASYDLNTKYLRRLWYVPLEDIVNVYRASRFFDVTEDDIYRGSLLLFAATQAASELGYLLYPLTSVSPFLQEEINSFYSGGMDDMVYWTLECWNRSIEWFSDSNKRPCSIFKEGDYTSSHELWRLHNISFWNKIVHSLTSQAQTKRLDGDLYISFMPTYPIKITDEDIEELVHTFYSKAHKHQIDTVVSLLKDKLYDGNGGFEVNFKKDYQELNTQKSCTTVDDHGNIQKITLDSKYSYLGSKITHGNITGIASNDIIVNAPGYSEKGWEQGAVYIIPSQVLNKHIQLESPPKGVIKLTGESNYGRFGDSVAVVDLNGDGIDDLAVSSPRIGSEKLKYNGIISIFYGSKENGLSRTPSITIFSSTSFSNIGTELKGIDIDNDGYKDLIIGSPYSCDLTTNCLPNASSIQRGSVSFFLSSKWNKKVYNKKTIDISESDWIQYGKSGYEWFGSKIEFVYSKKLLVISAPAHADAQYKNNGAVYGFLIKDILRDIKNTSITPSWTLKGDSNFSKFGFDLSSGNPFERRVAKEYLSISMPTHSNNFIYDGSVNLFDLETMKPLLKASGKSQFSRFGWKSSLNDINHDGYDDYIISEPWFNEQSGRILIWNGQKGLDLNKEPNTCLTLGNMKHAMFGMDFDTFSFENTTKLVVSSPRYSEYGDISGAVFVITQNA